MHGCYDSQEFLDTQYFRKYLISFCDKKKARFSGNNIKIQTKFYEIGIKNIILRSIQKN